MLLQGQRTRFRRLLPGVLPPVYAGQHAVFPLEGLHEGMAVGKTCVCGDRLNGVVGLEQLVYRVVKADACEIV